MSANHDLVIRQYQQLLANATHQVILSQANEELLRKEIYDLNMKLEQYQDQPDANEDAKSEPHQDADYKLP